jgi:hypothetical protein
MAKQKKMHIPLYKIVAGLMILNQATGKNFNETLDALVKALTGGASDQLLSQVQIDIMESMRYIRTRPLEAATNLMIAAGVAYSISMILKGMGVPKSVDLGVCYVDIR